MLARLSRKENCGWEYKLVLPPWKAVWRFPKELKLEISFGPAIPLLGIHTKEYKSFYNKDTCTHMLIITLFTIVSTCNQHRCPSVVYWIKKMYYRYTMGYYIAIKKNEFMFFAETWMELEAIILSKLMKEQKTKYHIFSLISGC